MSDGYKQQRRSRSWLTKGRVFFALVFLAFAVAFLTLDVKTDYYVTAYGWHYQLSVGGLISVAASAVFWSVIAVGAFLDRLGLIRR